MTSRSHAVPARAAQESLRLLATLEKDIPVMRALTNPNLKDRHWWQVRRGLLPPPPEKSLFTNPRRPHEYLPTAPASPLASVWECGVLP